MRNAREGTIILAGPQAKKMAIPEKSGKIPVPCASLHDGASGCPGHSWTSELQSGIIGQTREIFPPAALQAPVPFTRESRRLDHEVPH
jgi:hypothetical protein